MVYSGRGQIGSAMRKQQSPSSDFTRFVKEIEPQLSYAFYAAFGPEVGSEVTAEALAYAWENWPRVCELDNPAGYLYRVGQSRARKYHRPRICFPDVPRTSLPEVEPRLPEVLKRLTRNQRIAVVLVHGMEWTEQEVADLIGRSRSTVRTHLERGLARLRDELEVTIDA